MSENDDLAEVRARWLRGGDHKPSDYAVMAQNMIDVENQATHDRHDRDRFLAILAKVQAWNGRFKAEPNVNMWAELDLLLSDPAIVATAEQAYSHGYAQGQRDTEADVMRTAGFVADFGPDPELAPESEAYELGKQTGLTMATKAIAELAAKYDTPENQWPIEPKVILRDIRQLWYGLGGA